MPSAAAKVDNQEPREKAVIDVARQQTAPGVDAALLKIVAASKTSPLKIMRDYVGLAFGPGKITFEDYSQLRLFDSAFWSGVNLRTVVGRRGSAAIYQAINYRHDWWALAANKVASTSYLAAHGFPVIPILAIYCSNLKTGTANVACNEQQLRKILTVDSNYPMFGKPAEGVQSLGSVGLRRYVPQTKSLETHEDREIPLETFVEQLRTNYPAGYLFQKFLVPHTAIRALCGDRLATVRVITLATEAGPKVFRVCWKIPAGANVADNYWRKGNLLAKIDISQGRVLRAVSGVGLDLVQHDRHPDTNAPLIDFQIPHWQHALDTVIEAARMMRHIPLIGWDVAVLDEGPVIVEMNENPDFFLPQLADGRGVLEAELTDFMAVQKRKFAEDKKSNVLTFKT
jgi:Sugar-transfer associated ATP-grasp